MTFLTILKRLREPSSLAGVAALATLVGINVEAAQGVAQAVTGIAGALAVLIPEGRSNG